MYEALGLCGRGKGGRLIDTAKWVTNRSGTMRWISSSPFRPIEMF